MKAAEKGVIWLTRRREATKAGWRRGGEVTTDRTDSAAIFACCAGPLIAENSRAGLRALAPDGGERGRRIKGVLMREAVGCQGGCEL